MRFTVRWWPRLEFMTNTEPFAVLDEALARGEDIWASHEARRVQVLIDGHDVAWEQPVA